MGPKKLVELCQQGDEQALSLLYQTYADKMRRICCKYISDEQTANDLLHDGFIIIFTSIGTLRSPEKLESWMAKIMKNISLRYLEQCRSSTTIPIDIIEEAEEPYASYPKDFPSYAVMLRMIESLPKGYSQIFKLAVLEGLSHKEIGQLLNIAPHSSSSQLSRAKLMLRRLLSQYRMVIGLFFLSSFIFIYKLLYIPSKNTVMIPKAAIEPHKKGPKKKSIPSHQEVVLVSVPAKRYAYTMPSKEKTVMRDSVRQEIIAEKKDSAQSTDHPENGNQSHRKGEIPRHGTIPPLSSGNSRNWLLALSYSGGERQTKLQSTNFGDISSGVPQKVIERSYHHIPITLSLSLRKQINKRWGIETGLQYTRLRSDFTTITDSCRKKTQKINYIGIPLKGTFTLWNGERFSLYASAGATLDIPVKGTSEETTSYENGQPTSQTKTNLHPSLQWSAHFGVGMQYQITPTIGIYAEPNLHYYFNNGDGIKTNRTEKPFNVALPIGFRFSW